MREALSVMRRKVEGRHFDLLGSRLDFFVDCCHSTLHTAVQGLSCVQLKRLTDNGDSEGGEEVGMKEDDNGEGYRNGGWR